MKRTISPTWDHSRFVGNVKEFTLEGIVINNYLFGVSTIGKNGHESIITLPSGIIR